MSETNLLQAVFDNLHTAVIMLRPGLLVHCMNPSAEMLLQVSEKRAVGRTLREILLNQNDFFELLENARTSGHPFTVYDTVFRLQDGSMIHVDYSVSAIDFMSTEMYLMLEISLLSSYMKIAKENQLLHQHDATRSLLRGLAHEIKNPLGGIRGSAQLLERELDESGREYTHVIIREADRLQALVDRMLGPNNLPDKKPVNIHRIIEHVRQLVRAEATHVLLTADYDPSLPRLIADESMLIQAILNITRNAVNAVADDGSGEVRFRTRARRNTAIRSKTYSLVAQIEIIDNGEGIPNDIAEMLFFPMITGRVEGTGLGLSIAQTLIQQHDGLIEFTSEPGETRFIILLPLENDHDS